MKLIFPILLFCLILGEYSSSKYGGAVILDRYNCIPFEFQVKFHEGKNYILGEKEICIVNSGYTFLPPTEKDSFLVKEVVAFSVQNNSLNIFVKDFMGSDKFITIKSLSEDGFVDDYSLTTSISKGIKWVMLDKTIIQNIILSWDKIFWVIIFAILLTGTRSLFKFYNRTNEIEE